MCKRVERSEVSSYGIVVADAAGRVTSFQEKPRPAEARSDLANTGIYVFEPGVFDHIPRGGAFDIGSQLFPALVAAGAPLHAVEASFRWIDIGNAPPPPTCAGPSTMRGAWPPGACRRPSPDRGRADGEAPAASSTRRPEAG